MKQLDTEHLILREWEPSDSSDMFEYARDPRVGPAAGWTPHKCEAESREIIDVFIKENETWAMVLAETGKVIGSIGLHRRTPLEDADLHHREIGYVLNPAYWGKGYMPEAVREVMRFAFEEEGLFTVWCGHYDFNDRSRRVVEKSGFIYRFSKDKELPDGRRVKELCYALTRNEWETLYCKTAGK